MRRKFENLFESENLVVYRICLFEEYA